MCEIAEAPVVALILENGLAEVCGSPGGILEAITSHARKGEFHLARYLFDPAEQTAAARAH
jgi:hypothetical protein